MKKLSSEALDVLSCAVEITGNRLRLLGKLDRKLYVEVNEALEAIGGAWNRKTQAHLFESSPEAALDQILVDGGFHDTKRDLDQFFTPLSLARLGVIIFYRSVREALARARKLPLGIELGEPIAPAGQVQLIQRAR